jgi:hypothetical protein
MKIFMGDMARLQARFQGRTGKLGLFWLPCLACLF